MKNRPRSIGPYEVLAVVGRGATATVYEARHRQTGDVVALKVGVGFMGLEPGALERFQREFTVIRALDHANLVRSLGFAEEKDVPYVVLEFVPGRNLEETLKVDGPRSPEQTLALFTQIGEGLRYLHANHIVHRDIKPSNIFLHRDGPAKLGDFGLLKNLRDEISLTHSRQSMGTADYGAPEQFEDAKRVDGRCDLYSLAATMYFALTGKFPFGNGGHLQIMHRKLLYQFVPLRLLLPALDAALDELINRCLQPDLKQRPRDCDEFLAELRDCRAAADETLVDVAVPEAKPRTGKERRATLRFAVDLTASFVPFHQNMRGRWQATILDVSATGVRLQTNRPIAVNSVLQIAFDKQLAPELVLVRWVKERQGSDYVIGCSFVRPLQTPDLDTICGPETGRAEAN